MAGERATGGLRGRRLEDVGLGNIAACIYRGQLLHMRREGQGERGGTSGQGYNDTKWVKVGWRV